MAYTGPTKVDTRAAFQIWKWTGITDGDDDGMTPVKLEGYKDITAYLFGTISGSSVIQIKSCPDPADTPTLFAPMISQGTVISLVAANTCAWLDSLGIWYKPTLVDGDGSTLLTVYLIARV